MTNKDILEQALNGSPDEHEVVFSKLENRIGDLTNPLTIYQL